MSPLFGHDSRLRKDRTGANPFVVGAVTLALIAIGTYFGFAKHVPFTHGYQLKAVFSSANSIRRNSPVRIAGVNVGKVKAIERQSGSNAALITMEIDKSGLPIHKDADGEDPPADLPRGKLLRRPPARDPERADARRVATRSRSRRRPSPSSSTRS